MEILVWAFLGGIAGAVLMDVTETYAAKIGITSGVNFALVGRWFLGLLRGQFTHANLLDPKPFPHEVKAGWAFHFLVGGGGVALIYPLFFQATGPHLPNNHLLGGMLFGLATSLLPWFVLLPSFGRGFFGQRGPQGSNALLASTLSLFPTASVPEPLSQSAYMHSCLTLHSSGTRQKRRAPQFERWASIKIRCSYGN